MTKYDDEIDKKILRGMLRKLNGDKGAVLSSIHDWSDGYITQEELNHKRKLLDEIEGEND